jgi:hypothetical protein
LPAHVRAWLLPDRLGDIGHSALVVGAVQIAQVTIELATRQPELVSRNPAKIEKGWKQMRADRAAFIEFFGGDEMVLPAAEAGERLNAYYRHRQESALASRSERRRPRNVPGVDVPAFELPGELADADTIGIIYDEIDGLNFYNEYGMLRDLFADPALAADQAILGRAARVSGVGYHRPLPFRRLAAAHPKTVDAVFRKILHK